MKMRAPEGISSAAVGDTQYEVIDGHIEVENGEHIGTLEGHGFEQEDGDLTESDPPADEVGPCPEFGKFVNRSALGDWLVANGAEADLTQKRADLEAACVEHHAALLRGEVFEKPELVAVVEPEIEDDEKKEEELDLDDKAADPDGDEA